MVSYSELNGSCQAISHRALNGRGTADNSKGRVETVLWDVPHGTLSIHHQHCHPSLAKTRESKLKGTLLASIYFPCSRQLLGKELSFDNDTNPSIKKPDTETIPTNSVAFYAAREQLQGPC